MRFIILLYLMIAFMFSFLGTQTNGLLGDAVSVTGVNYTSYGTGEHNTLLAAQAGTDPSPESALAMVWNFVQTVWSMTTFSFSIPGAPLVVDGFIRGIFGIISILFWSYLAKEVIGLVPGLG